MAKKWRVSGDEPLLSFAAVDDEGLVHLRYCWHQDVIRDFVGTARPWEEDGCWTLTTMRWCSDDLHDVSCLLCLTEVE